ncbi:hypothetical protein AN641_09925 [Candidatus Epulonipiscioides gigas]|nr:hypothetical protein AN641_09925 [Epulopiscium sp. SCG-C07WGA-EpuloA2]
MKFRNLKLYGTLLLACSAAFVGCSSDEETISTVTETIEAPKEVEEVIEQAKEEVEEEVKEVIEEAKDVIEIIEEEVKEEVEEEVKDVIEEAKDVIEIIEEEVKEAIEQAKEIIEEVEAPVDEVIEEIKEEVEAPVDEVIEEIKEEVEAPVDEVIEEIKEEVEAPAEEVIEEIKEVVQDTVEEVKEELVTEKEDVKEEVKSEVTYPNGTYNLKFASADTRHTFMAAAENYLLNNQYGGIPLFSNAGYAIYSSRVQLPVDTYIPEIEFGKLADRILAADDSAVIMEDGKPGNAGEYTYRTAYSTNPQTWNHWLYEGSVDKDYMENYIGTLYDYEFNEDKTGYALLPSMAQGDPIPVNPVTLPSGKEVSKVWQIKIRDLEWKFNPNTDISMVTDTKINAVDFYETYKLALENSWMRAISGGGDFCATESAILNAQNFVDGTATWEEVGIKLIDDNTIQLEYVEDQSQWNVRYHLGSFVLSPIHTEMYAVLGEQYGTSETTIAYSGPFYVDYYESDKIVRMKENENHPIAEKQMITGLNITVIPDTEMRFEEFKAGKLDYSGLPATQYDEFKNHPALKTFPGSTVFRISINGLGTVENQVAQFPESTWVPEPILANPDFKKAMFFAIDRNKLAKDVMKTVEPTHFLFSSAYVVEAEEGTAFRDTVYGQSIGANLSPSTYGYNLDAAKASFDKALDTLVADGIYKSGDEIKIEFYFFSGSESQALMADYLKGAFEDAFNSQKHNIKVTVYAIAKEFPGIYDNHMQIGEFDLSIGGISGSTLNAASFLDVFADDDRSGFTLNWGIDTNVAEIPVTYTNDNGEVVTEMWSYNAISSALNTATEVVNGTENRK